MVPLRQHITTGKILDNVMFLAEVFGEQEERDIPKIPVLEMAKCFDLTPESAPAVSHRPHHGPLWK